MTTTDTDALRDKMARALHDLDQENAAAGGVMTDGDIPAVWKWAYEWADAVLPIVAEEVRKAKAEALEEFIRFAERRKDAALNRNASDEEVYRWATVFTTAWNYRVTETGDSDDRR